MSKLPLFLAVLLTLSLAAFPAAAREGGHAGGGHHGGHHHHHGHGAIFLGGSFGLYDPFYYPYAYAPYPYAYAAPVGGEAPANVWYLCPTANTYYPYVATCPVPWQLVQPY